MSAVRRERRPLGLRGCYDREGAAEYISVSIAQLDRLTAAGHLATFTPLGMKNAVRIRREELDRYITESEHQSTERHLQAVTG